MKICTDEIKSVNYLIQIINIWQIIKYKFEKKQCMKQTPKNNSKITDYFAAKNINNPLSRVLNKQPNKSVLDTYQYKHTGNKQKSEKQSNDGQQLTTGTEVINQNVQHQAKEHKIHKQMIMIGPCDVGYFQNQYKRLNQLKQNYSKSNFMKYLAANIKFHQINNLKILQQIKDQYFWNETARKIVSYSLERKNFKSISSQIPMLISKNPHLLQLSKSQVFMIILSMFLMLLPKQTHRSNLTFAGLLGTRQNEEPRAKALKLEKLKCFINYLKVMANRNIQQLQSAQINIQRVQNSFSRKQLKTCSKSMGQVQIKRGLIQDQYRKCIMVDFANKNIGGGVLSHGAVQQQILFCVFPQLLCLMPFCEELLDNEAIIISKVQRFNNYSGYSQDFKFEGTYDQKLQCQGNAESVIVAIDAVDYSKKLEPTCQFLPTQIERQIMKAIAGMHGAQVLADMSMPICTGRWGCGAFKGDNYLKFMVQWIACAIANRKMVYKAQDDSEEKELKTMYKFMAKYEVAQLLQVSQQYHSVVGKPKSSKKLSFLHYLKEQI